MKRISGVLIVIVSLVCGSIASAEEVTIETFYPSPDGTYRNLSTTGETHLATTSGSVGIGVPAGTAPGGILEVRSASPVIVVNGTVDNNIRGIVHQANNVPYFSDTSDRATGEHRVEITGVAESLQTFYTNGAERMRINTAGNVGIGKSPTAKLDVLSINGSGTPAMVVQQDQANQPTLQVRNITAGATGNLLQVDSPWGTAMVIDANGNVGIGTANPTSKLTVSGGSIQPGNVYSGVSP